MKKILAAAVLAAACAVIAIGGTFAWFTDTATTSKSKIVYSPQGGNNGETDSSEITAAGFKYKLNRIKNITPELLAKEAGVTGKLKDGSDITTEYWTENNIEGFAELKGATAKGEYGICGLWRRG